MTVMTCLKDPVGHGSQGVIESLHQPESGFISFANIDTGLHSSPNHLIYLELAQIMENSLQVQPSLQSISPNPQTRSSR